MATLIPTPDTLAQALENIHDMIGEETCSADDIKSAQRMLRVASRNMRALFELEVDPATGLLKPRNAGQLWYLVDIMIRAGTIPRGYEISKDNKDPDPAKVFIGAMKALEVGVEPVTGIANIMIVNNGPTVWGDLAQALVQRSGEVEWQEKIEIGGPKPGPEVELKNWPNGFGYRCLTKRKGQEKPYEGEYTVGQAKRAKLWMNANKQPWISDPDEMLWNRARARSQRSGFADGLYGFAIGEEQDDIIALPPPDGAAPVQNAALDDDAPPPAVPQLADATARPEPTLDDLGAGPREREPVERGRPDPGAPETLFKEEE